ncbi:hypothetical protein [Agathobaculum sp.]|uniref:hypothetical protein n=1 Tax=Agathobaculum sp. TaxID=2048138 RepID=UPI0039A0A8DA
MTNDSRLRKIGNKVLDAGAADLEEYAVNATHEVLRQVKDWLVNLYNSRISNTHNTTAVLKLEDLEKRIQLSNESINIDMEKKEIAVMWAMRKLGYTEDETAQVLKTANEAYSAPKD